MDVGAGPAEPPFVAESKLNALLEDLEKVRREDPTAKVSPGPRRELISTGHHHRFGALMHYHHSCFLLECGRREMFRSKRDLEED